ncbi:MAG: hypothetical protein JWO38_6255 [Gemmataceae bacterium]|nr:hypothetical protein [Gemmataceae bacterium]
MAARRTLGLTLFLLLALGVGCGKKSNAPANVSGTVTTDGTTVTGGSLMFHSDSGVYTASIQSDGTYTAVDLPTGNMVVTVDTEALNPKRKQPTYVGQGGQGDMAAKYGAGGKGGQTKGDFSGKSPQMNYIPEGVQPVEAGGYVKISRIYSDKATSPLKLTVTPGDQKFNLELTDKK